jgi:hypothetical protein
MMVATIMEESRDGLNEKQERGRGYDIIDIFGIREWPDGS